ncbi:MAG: AtpZ/AtpI family protein [Candidatus Cloacimonetes bacterium]|nr:AtpZ/AtpI family protein [Candidatus Cloacimonadota bacterium]MBL7107794.1 AtpZ/AtpI family protein [Candidatus Cloacimonadota bacterium]
MNQKNQKKKNQKYYKEIFLGLGLIAQLGLTMVICILVMFFVGMQIDNYFGLRKVGIVIFIFLGIITGAIACYKLLKRSENRK